MGKSPFDEAFGFDPSTFEFSFDFTGSNPNWVVEEDVIVTQIKYETIEYFTPILNTDMNFALNRKRLSKEQKERVFGFMKERLKWYGENGILMK